jgi:signal transduction histidine kinase/DNA-binding response OmpR family regulator/HPt (histidine-containing phosphotransfer) domain-containing protein
MRSLATLLVVKGITAAVVFSYFAYIDLQTFEANKAFWRTETEPDYLTFAWVVATVMLAEFALAWYYSRSLWRHEARLQAGESTERLPSFIRRRAASYPLIIALISLVGWALVGLYYARGGLALLAPAGLLPSPMTEIIARTVVGLVLLTGLTGYTLVAFLLDDTARTPRQRVLLVGANLATWALAAVLFDRGGMMPPASDTFWRTFTGIGVIGGLTAATTTFLIVDATWRRSLPRFFPTGDIAALGVPRVTVGARLVVATMLTGILPLLVLSVAVVAGAQNLDMIVVFVAIFGIGSTVLLSLLTARSLLQPLNDLTVAIDNARQSPGTPQLPPRLSNDELGDLTTRVRIQIEANNLLLAENVRLESALSIQNLEQQVAERTAELAWAKEEAEAARRLAEQANESKGAFLAMMSHEIRTPMNAIIGMTSLLLNTPLTSDQADFAQTIRHSGESLLVIINDILDFSKIEANKLELEIQPFDLRDCIEGTLGLLITRADEKGIELAYDMAEGTPEAIWGDENRLRQILVNLLNNAIKFTNAGEVTVTVEARPLTAPAAEDTYELHIAVRDTGIGIPPERMDRLFQAFSQVDASTTRRYGGTGLGLVISQRLSQMMGGRIWVESDVGVGSTFHFTIHARPADTSSHAYLHTVQDQLAGKHLLIVDDNPTNRRIIRLFAHKWGMHTRETEFPIEALQWVQQGERFDLALLDMQMPEMDGITLAARMQQSDGAHIPPIILLTSLGGRGTTTNEHCEQADLAAFLTRPIRPAQLFQVLVNASLGRQEAPTAPQAAPEAFDEFLGQRHPLRILLAEDNATNQKLALHFLRQLGYQADIATDGVEAMAALYRQTYDLVFLDVHMPEMDGLEAARRIVAEWPAKQRPRLVAMTASAMPGDREMCLQAGMDDYLSKPIRLPALVAALERATSTDTAAPAVEPAERPATPAPLDDQPVLPPDALQRMLNDVGGDRAFFRQLIEGFLADATHLLNDLRQGYAAGDTARVQRAAHTLKSNAREFHATMVAELCQEVELLCRTAPEVDLGERVAHIDAMYSRLHSELETALAASSRA